MQILVLILEFLDIWRQVLLSDKFFDLFILYLALMLKIVV